MAYPQIIKTYKDEFKLIEIASRIPGGFMREMSLLVSGIDPIEFLIKSSIGEKNLLKKIKPKNKKKAVYIKFFTKIDFRRKKIIKKIKGIDHAKKIDGIYDIFFKKTLSIPKLKLSE